MTTILDGRGIYVVPFEHNGRKGQLNIMVKSDGDWACIPTPFQLGAEEYLDNLGKFIALQLAQGGIEIG